MEKGKKIRLDQRPKAESDPAVAAAGRVITLLTQPTTDGIALRVDAALRREDKKEAVRRALEEL